MRAISWEIRYIVFFAKRRIMKKLIFATSLFIASSLLSVFAVASVPQLPNIFGDLGPNTTVYFASWCQEGYVVFNPDMKQQKLPIRCADYNKTCVQEERILTPVLINISASCK